MSKPSELGDPFLHDASVEEAAAYVLEQTTGLDVSGNHGLNTPQRFVRMLRELTSPEEFQFTVFPNEENVDEMVIVRDIPFVSVCNHHIIPFTGMAHIAYIPDQKIVGLSKFARVVRFYARRLQVQEVLTQQVANYLEEHLDPVGVAVVLSAEHFCMTIRGVQSPGTRTVTSAMKGVFLDPDKGARNEFMHVIGSDI